MHIHFERETFQMRIVCDFFKARCCNVQMTDQSDGGDGTKQQKSEAKSNAYKHYDNKPEKTHDSTNEKKKLHIKST